MRRSRMLRRWLAHVRSRLVLVRWRRRLPARFWRGGVSSIVRDSGILRTRSSRIIGMRCTLMFRRTRYVIGTRRSAIAMWSRLSLVHVRWRMRRLSGGFRSGGVVAVVGHCRIIWPWRGSVVVRLPFSLPGWRMRNIIIIIRRIGVRWVIAIGSGRSLGRMRSARVACLSLLRGTYRWIIRHRCILRRNHTGTVEGSWFGSCRYFRPAVVHRRPLRTIVARQLFMLGLHRSRTDVSLACCSFLGSTGPGIDSSLSAVVANTIHGVVNHRGVVGVVNVGDVYAIHGSVIVKISTVPITALIAVTVVAIAVVNAAIEPNLRTPVSGIPHVGVAAPSPVAGCP